MPAAAPPDEVSAPPPGPRRSAALRYAGAGFTVALPTWVRLQLDPVLADRCSFATLLFAVLLLNQPRAS